MKRAIPNVIPVPITNVRRSALVPLPPISFPLSATIRQSMLIRLVMFLSSSVIFIDSCVPTPSTPTPAPISNHRVNLILYFSVVQLSNSSTRTKSGAYYCISMQKFTFFVCTHRLLFVPYSLRCPLSRGSPSRSSSLYRESSHHDADWMRGAHTGMHGDAATLHESSDHGETRDL